MRTAEDITKKVPVRNLKIEKRAPKSLSGRDSLFVSFDYSERGVNYIKNNIRKKAFCQDTKEWEILPADEGLVHEGLFDVADFGESIDMTDIRSSHDTSPVPLGHHFRPPVKPYKHQLEAIYYGMKKDSWLLLDEMGVGKTVTALFLAMWKVTPGKHTLIIVGFSSLRYKWESDALEYAGVKAHILGHKDTRANINNKHKLKDIEERAWGDAPFIITNAETMRDKACLLALKPLFKSGEIEMLIVDEIQNFKNIEARQTKGLHWLKPKYKIGLTGTLFKNSPLDAYAPLKWIGETEEKFYKFKERYCWLEYSVPPSGKGRKEEIIGYHDLKELAARVASVSVRRTKDEHLDLPEKTYVKEWVEMDSSHRKIYGIVSKALKDHELTKSERAILTDERKLIDLIGMPKDPRVLMARLKQATCEPSVISTTYSGPGAKIERAVSLAEAAAWEGRKTIIYSLLEPAAHIAAKAASHLGAVAYTGKTDDRGRLAAEKAFMEDENVKVLCATIGTCGAGLTLTSATLVIFTDLPWTSSDFEQAVDRAHRIGQARPITIYTILCKNTADERIYDIVQRKKAVSDFLLEGKVDKKRFAKFLLDDDYEKEEKMQYSITFSCGHAGTVELFGKGSERQNKIQWYEESGKCPACYREEMRAREKEKGLVLDVEIISDVGYLLYDRKNIVRLSFSGDTMPNKDSIKALGYVWQEKSDAGFFGGLSDQIPPKAWSKHINPDDLESELDKAKGIGAAVGKMPTDQEIKISVTTIKKLEEREEEKKKKIEAEIAKIEKPTPPDIWRRKIKGCKCNRTIYGGENNKSVYADGKKITLSASEAAELEAYWSKREKYEAAVKDVKTRLA